MIFQRLNRWHWSALIAALVVVLTGIAGGAHAAYYADRVLPQTTLAGTDISGMTRDELNALLDSQASGLSVDVHVGENTHSIELAELGATVDIPQTVTEVMTANDSFWQRMLPLRAQREFEPVVSMDADQAQSAVTALVQEEFVVAKDAGVAWNEEKGSFDVVPAVPGSSVEFDDVTADIKATALSLKSGTVDAQLVEVAPKISTEAAKAAADKANAVVATEVALYGGGYEFIADAQEKSTWTTITCDAEKGICESTLNTENITSWVSNSLGGAESDGAGAVRYVDEDGNEIRKEEPNGKRRVVNDKDSFVQAALEAVQAGKSYSAEFTVEESDPEYETVIAGGYAGNSGYAPAAKERWIDINLSNNTVTALEGNTPVYGPVPMVPGAPETPTVTGTFKVWLQVREQTMRGFNADGSRYETPGVPWITYFHGDYAIHGAPWRSSFGWSGPGGSHGCVNVPVSDAQYFYNFATNGMTVVSHY